MSYVKMARTCKKRTISYVFWRYRTLHIRCRTKNIRRRIRHRIRYRTSKWQEPVQNVRYRTSDVRCRIQYRIRYIHEQMLFSSHSNTSLSLQALFHPYLLKTAMTRIVHGILMMKGIMLTSSLHHVAPWHTIPDHGIPLPSFCPLFRTGVSWT
jgi:hypothetical protein